MIRSLHKVSIVCPIYNAEKYLEETVHSVRGQTYPHWELLLVLDAQSTDQSQAIAQKWSQKDNRIHLLESEAHRGVAHNRNHGIQKATGDFIAFLDADDLWLPQKLEKQISFMIAHTIDFSYHSYQQMSSSGELLPLVRKAPPTVSYISLLKTNSIGCLTVMIRAEKAKRHSFRPHMPHEDFLFWLEILKEIPQAEGLDEVLAHYRIVPQSRSSNKKRAAYDRWLLYRKILKINLIKSIYYFAFYSLTAILQRLKPRRD